MLEIVGLTSSEEAVYLALLDLPPVTVSDALQACTDIERADVLAALESLADKGLVNRLQKAPRRYTPVAPETVLGIQLMDREEELNRARAVVADLSQRYRSVPRQTGVEELVEIVTGKRRTLQRWLGALRSANSQVRVLERPPFESQSADPYPAEVEVLSRGVPVKVVYDQSGVRSPIVIARRRAEIAAGEQARMTGEVPLHLLLVDDRLALMPLRQDRPRTDGLLVVYPCALLDGLSALFEKTWNEAIPFTLDASSPPDGSASVFHNATTRTILSLLAAGLSDQAIARRLGCSERTVQRYVQRMMDAVGAKTRFQAALQIGQRNWTESARHPGQRTGAPSPGQQPVPLWVAEPHAETDLHPGNRLRHRRR